MATLLFKLRSVPDDEAEDIRILLTESSIDFYETTAGSWGISLPALWLHNNNQLAQAKELIANYQKERAIHAQKTYAEQCNDGSQRTVFNIIQEAPLKFFIYLFGIIFVLYLATIPVSFLFSS
ncbi:MAG: hypothetical protein JKY80_06805 [Mariprofundaceae bacterium]|nr:hypothetical protein [Mariprofundaceae bacterium]